MNVVMITPTPPDINAFGMRILSAVLKKAGHSTKVIFLPGGIEHLRFDAGYIYQYSSKTLQQIGDICKDAHLIGFSFMSPYFDRAVQITEFLRRNFTIPVIWGGTHPTYRPEECLRYCDIVCIGEGESAIIEIADKMAGGVDYTDTKNCWFKVDGKIRRNERHSPIHDLDALPFADYDLEDHYLYDWMSEDIVPIDEGVMKDQFLRMPYFNGKHLITYRTMTSRGCPHHCSFCASSITKPLRRRTVDNVMDEIETILEKFAYIELISFFDDTFFAAPLSYFEEFGEQYRKRIGFPFHAQCSPTTINKRKMDMLVDTGLFFTEMGIQTGSERIKRMYRREVSNERVIEAAALIDTYRSRMVTPDYHVILDNPWEKTEDVKDTLKLLLDLPGKFELQISSLVLFPGTELNDMARKEGLLKDELNEVLRKPFTFPKETYLNYLIYLSGFPVIPRWLLRILSKDLPVQRFQRDTGSAVYKFLFKTTDRLRLIGKGIVALLTGDFRRIINYFKLVR